MRTPIPPTSAFNWGGQMKDSVRDAIRNAEWQSCLVGCSERLYYAISCFELLYIGHYINRSTKKGHKSDACPPSPNCMQLHSARMRASVVHHSSSDAILNQRTLFMSSEDDPFHLRCFKLELVVYVVEAHGRESCSACAPCISILSLSGYGEAKLQFTPMEFEVMHRPQAV